MKRILTLCVFAAAVSACAQDPKPNYEVPIHGHGKTVDTPSGKVYYEKEGAGPPVFIVAGGPGGGHASFHPWFSRLAKDHTVVYVDNIGRGRSDRLKDPAGYTVPRDADDLEAVRKSLGVDRISLIGHSYGGMPALAYALEYPQHTSRLVLSDTIYSEKSFQANIDNANANARNQYSETWAKLMEMRRNGTKSSTEEYEDLYGGTTMDVYWFDLSNEEKMFHSGDPADGFNPEVYAAMLGDDAEWKVGGTMKGYDPSKRMRKMTTPTLICVGRYDRISLPRVAAEMQALIPGARLETFERSGHRPWVEETDRYFAVVDGFLADH